MENKHWELIAKNLSGNASDEEVKALARWIKESPENEIIFNEAKEIWSGVRKEQEITPDARTGWRVLKDKLLSLDPTIHLVSLSIDGYKRWLVAASVLLLIFASIFIFKTHSGYVELKTANQVKIFYLPDSSKIWLNKNSVLRYSKMFNKERIVYLQGEAFFDITRDTTRPFIINTKTSITRVLGTSFNLKVHEENKSDELVVVEGLVRFSSNIDPSKNVLLRKGEKGVCTNDGKEISQKVNDDDNFLSWLNKDKIDSPFNSEEDKIKENELKSPASYLKSSFTWKENLIRQTIIEGNVSNSSVFTTYKNIQLKVLSFGAKGETLSEEVFYIESIVEPGLSVPFKHKLKIRIKKTEKIKMEVIYAKAVK